MNKYPIISVIVPVYNCEKYLPKCLDSLIYQTYENLEIICIDDGSTDKSPDILEDYAKKDKRITIITEENKGQGTARNAGLSAAKGDYISFIDADDWVSLTLYKTFIDALGDKKIDIFMFNGESYNELPEHIFPERFFDITIWNNHLSAETIHTFHDCCNPFGGNFSACNKIYGKSFLIDKDIKFIEGTLFEDQLFYVETLLKSESVMVTDETFYKYRNSNASSVTKNIKERVFDIFKIVNSIDGIVRELGLYEEFKYALFQYKYEELVKRFLDTRFILKPKFYQKMKNVLTLAKDDSLDYKILNRLKNFQNYQKIMNSDCFEFYLER